jgi:hypothetical protein
MIDKTHRYVKPDDLERYHRVLHKYKRQLRHMLAYMDHTQDTLSPEIVHRITERFRKTQPLVDEYTSLAKSTIFRHTKYLRQGFIHLPPDDEYREMIHLANQMNNKVFKFTYHLTRYCMLHDI